MRNQSDVLKGPCLTEKATLLHEIDGKVVFKVHLKANKIDIRKAVERMFNVKVSDVKTAAIHGKRKRVGKHFGYTPNWKKAYVSLAEGEINFADEL